MGEGIVIIVYYRRVVTKNQLCHSLALGGILTQDAFIVFLPTEGMKKTTTLPFILLNFLS
jgi:hypothetical protein